MRSINSNRIISGSLMTSWVVLCGACTPVVGEGPGDLFGITGVVDHLAEDAAVEASAWRWRELHPDDDGVSQDVWVVGAYAWEDVAECSHCVARSLDGRFGFLAIDGNGGTLIGEVLASWSVYALASTGFVDHTTVPDASPERLQTIARQLYNSESAPHILLHEASLPLDPTVSYSDHRMWHGRSLRADGVATRAWSYGGDVHLLPRFATSLDQPEAQTPLLYAGGTGIPYKFCALTGDEVTLTADGYSWCLPDCQQVPAEERDNPTHLIRDTAGEPLIPFCPDDFSTWGH